MTILGLHTVDETQHLMKTVEFRIEKAKEVYNQIPEAMKTAYPEDYSALKNDWTAWQARWVKARDEVLTQLLVLRTSNPLLPNSSIPAENEYKKVKAAINVGGADTYARGDLMDCILRIEKAANQVIDERNKPLPEGWDPDFAGYKAVDGAIKKGEAAASAAADAGKKLASNNLGLVVLGGVGLIIAGVVVTKVYL